MPESNLKKPPLGEKNLLDQKGLAPEIRATSQKSYIYLGNNGHLSLNTKYIYTLDIKCPIYIEK